jgi:carbamoyl-phosphate synthase large subunit
MKRVLVSGAGGDVAQGVIVALNKSSLDIEVFTICITRYSSWLHKVEHSYLSPPVISSKYIPFLIDFIVEHNIDVFFPCIDFEILAISENKSQIESATGVTIMVDDFHKVKIANDKFLTYEFLKNNSFLVPSTCIPVSNDVVSDFVEKVGFPIIAKKRVGRGGMDMKIINTSTEARGYIDFHDYILQEYIHGDDHEITAGVYLSDNGKVISICILLRELKNGSTFRAKRIINKKLESYLSLVAETLGMKYLNIQARLFSNEAYIFEVNGRFSGTTGIISRVFNAPEMFIREKILNEKLPKIDNTEIFYAMRYMEEVIVGEKTMKKLEERSSVKDGRYTGLWS